jgi:hypothetical protein
MPKKPMLKNDVTLCSLRKETVAVSASLRPNVITVLAHLDIFVRLHFPLGMGVDKLRDVNRS